jgi:beta-1,4-mannosyltransferase
MNPSTLGIRKSVVPLVPYRSPARQRECAAAPPASNGVSHCAYGQIGLWCGNFSTEHYRNIARSLRREFAGALYHMKRIYLSPINSREQKTTNPYTYNLCEALLENFIVVNSERPPKYGILNIMRYLHKIDIVYFNWIEEIPRKQFGIFQTLFLFVILIFFRIKGIKVIWTLHNKKSHWKKRKKITKLIYLQMLRRSDLIITHAREGLKLVKDPSKAYFIHHPVREIKYKRSRNEIPESDLLIWGSISPYKGIVEFIEFLENRGLLNAYNLLIAGKISSEELSHKFKVWESSFPKLLVFNEFLPEESIMACINSAKIVLFTYHSDSVLSSGALMDTLSQKAFIIGPDTGAFKDLAELGIIDTYQNFTDLLERIDRILNTQHYDPDRKKAISKFLMDNTWENFSKRLKYLIQGID